MDSILNTYKPDFFVVGTQKSATTSLHHYLSEHPDIFLPVGKETKFFADDERYKYGIEQYLTENFADTGDCHCIGEVDPDYMYFPSALERISEHFDLSTLKLVFMLRDPAKRAYSHYTMTMRHGLETLSFEEAIDAE